MSERLRVLAVLLLGLFALQSSPAQQQAPAVSGNAEVGLISLPSALAPRLTADGSYVEIPAGFIPPILQ